MFYRHFVICMHSLGCQIISKYFLVYQAVYCKMIRFITKAPTVRKFFECLTLHRGHDTTVRYTTTKYPFRIKVIPAPAMAIKTYESKNENLKREISPHLSVYKPQITSVLSISLRFSGIALAIVAWAMGLTMLMSDQNADYFVQEGDNLKLPDWFWSLSRFAIAFPFSFHFINGIRHIAFMTASFLEIKQIYFTGYLVIVLSILLATSLVMIDDIQKYLKEEEKKAK